MPETDIKTTNSNLDKQVCVELARDENVDVSSLSPKPSTSEYEAHSDADLETDESLNGCFKPREPSEWPDTITDNERQIIVRMGLHGESDLQAMAENLPSDLEGKKFPSYLLYTETLNGREKLARDYLVSSKTGCLFCAPCRVYISETGTKQKLSTLATVSYTHLDVYKRQLTKRKLA